MPNQDNNNQNPPNQQPQVVDIPPLPPDFQAVSQSSPSSATPMSTSPNTSDSSSTVQVTTEPLTTEPTSPEPISGSDGSSAPEDMLPPIVTSPPKKKFGGGRIIATILGILLLVGGVGTGVYLTQQNQNPEEKAGGLCTTNSQCGSGKCINGICVNQCQSDNNCPVGSECKGGECVPKGNDPGDQSCPSGQTNCGGRCVNLQTDAGNCGACTNACGSGTCVSGQCHNGNNDTLPTCTASGAACSTTISPIGSTSCRDASGTQMFCCKPGEQNINGVCSSLDNASCGRNLDTGAPVCCSQEVKNTCPNKVCEAPRRLECNMGGTHCTIETNSSQCGGVNPPDNPTNPPATQPPATLPPAVYAPQCVNVKAYNQTGTELTTAQLSQLDVGAVVKFCVRGNVTKVSDGIEPQSPGTFDQAQFSINNSTKPVVNFTQTDAARGICQTYTISATDRTVTVKAKVHHSRLGWVGEQF